MHMYSSLSMGSTNHKTVDSKSNPLLKLYYTSRVALFMTCALNELFYIGLYVGKYYNGNEMGTSMTLIGNIKINWIHALIGITLPGWIFKQFMNVIQIKNAANNLALLDTREQRKITHKKE